MSRKRSILLLFTLVVASLAPSDAGALPGTVSIESIDPDRVPEGSPATTVTIIGSGFQREHGPGPTRMRSIAYVDGSKVRTTFVNAHRLRAHIPRSFFASPDDLSIRVQNIVGVGPAVVPTAMSNYAYLEVYTVPASIRVDVPANAEVGGWFTAEFSVLDADGEPVYEDFEMTVSADNIATPEAEDGDVEFFSDCCPPAPLEQPFHTGNWNTWIYARSDVPQTLSIIARTTDGLVGVSNPIRVAGGFVTGKVTDSSGAPVAGVQVHGTSPSGEGFLPRLFPSSSYGGCFVGQPWHPMSFNRGWHPSLYLEDPIAITAVDGTFASRAVPPSVNAVYFKPAADSFLAGNWLGGAHFRSTSETIEIVDDGTVSGVDGVLEPGGTVSGRVEAGEGTLGTTTVQIVDSASGDPVAMEFVGEDGSYRSTGVPAGNYAVRFEPTEGDHVAQWFPARSDLDDAEVVTVANGADTGGVDAVLHRGARLHGDVLDPDGAKHYGTIAVYDVRTGNIVADGWADPDGDGFVTSPGLPAGDYKLRGQIADAPSAVLNWYGGNSFSTAATISLGDGEDRAFDLHADRAAAFTGKVHSMHSGSGLLDPPVAQPSRYVGVRVHDAATGRVKAYGCTGSSGGYTTAGLAPGSYQLEFIPMAMEDSSEALAPAWYPGVPDRAHAEVLTISDQEQRDVDMELDLGLSISGVIRTPAGDPLPAGLTETAYVEAYGQESGHYFFAMPATDGSFRVSGLTDGNYRMVAEVWSYDYEYEAPYMRTWYPAAASRGSGADITVAGADVDGRDILLGTKSRISGAISGVPATSWAYAKVVDALSGETVGWADRDEDGTYETSPLRGGTYQLNFVAGHRAPQWYGGTRTRSEALTVVLPDGGTVPGVDVSMGPGHQMLGTVRAGHSGAGIGGIGVGIVDAETGEMLGVGYTRPDGRYKTSILAPGSYRVVFNPENYNDEQDIFAEQWYADQPSFSTANPVTLAADADLTGINAVLHLR